MSRIKGMLQDLIEMGYSQDEIEAYFAPETHETEALTVIDESELMDMDRELDEYFIDPDFDEMDEETRALLKNLG